MRGRGKLSPFSSPRLPPGGAGAGADAANIWSPHYSQLGNRNLSRPSVVRGVEMLHLSPVSLHINVIVELLTSVQC